MTDHNDECPEETSSDCAHVSGALMDETERKRALSRERNRRYRKRHRDRVREESRLRTKAWRERNPEAARANNRSYYRANREAELAKKRNYYQNLRNAATDLARANEIIEGLEARVAELEQALRAIRIEAERETGRWVHLKRCIAIQSKSALKGEAQ